jgi:DNA replication protein DnaC
MTHEITTPLLLKQLHLPIIKLHFEAIEEQAQNQHWSYREYLATLCELECAHRYEQRLIRRLKESKLPAGKTLAVFNFEAMTSINPAQIQALAENISWIKKAENLILFGPSGVGKTHLAAAIGHALLQQDIRVLFSSTMTLVQQLQQAYKEYRLPDVLNKLSRFELVILDDIGYVKKDAQETSVLFELIAERYESGSLIITANQPFSE